MVEPHVLRPDDFKQYLSSLVALSSIFQALRVSMEEQRQRQEEEARRVTAASATEAGIPTPIQDGNKNGILLFVKICICKGCMV